VRLGDREANGGVGGGATGVERVRVGCQLMSAGRGRPDVGRVDVARGDLLLHPRRVAVVAASSDAAADS